jgi:multidrug efflux pump subunit AcrA (membrane-fusion protein)
MFKKRSYWIVLIIIFVLTGSGFYYYTTTVASNDTQAEEEPELQTAVARQGDLTVFASAAGQVVPAAEMGLGFDESGTIAEILVQVGDEVEAGQALARLQTDETPESIAAALAEAELNVIKAQQALDDIYANAELDAANALLAIEAAQKGMEDLLSSDLEASSAWQAVVEAEDAVDTAQRDVYISRATAGQADIDAAYAAMLLAENALEKQQDNFKSYADLREDSVRRASAQSKLSEAQAAYDDAVRNYTAMTSTMDEEAQAIADAKLATAQAQLADAQREWERVKDGPSAGDIAMAEAELAAAQAEWEVREDGPDPAEIVLAEAELANAQAKLDLAQEEQAVIELVSPINGTILAIEASIGESIGTSPFITLADLEQPLMEVYLDETDLDKVAVGFEAEVIFDAFPGDTFTGHIVLVDPSLSTVSNVQVVRTLVSLDADSFAKPLSLPVGLNASVDIIGGRAENAVLVPVEALRELGPEEYAVFVVEDGEPTLRIVEVGLIDFVSAEIISGLDAGEIVTTGIVETE